MKTHWQKIGQIGRPHGLGGHFFLSAGGALEQRPAFEASLGSEPGCGIPITVERLGNLQRATFKIDGVNDRDSILHLQGQALWVKGKAPGETKYLTCKVRDREGYLMGTVTDICNYGASDLLVIEDADQRRLEIPFIDNYLDRAIEEQGDTSCLALKVSRSHFVDFWF